MVRCLSAYWHRWCDVCATHIRLKCLVSLSNRRQPCDLSKATVASYIRKFYLKLVGCIKNVNSYKLDQTSSRRPIGMTRIYHCPYLDRSVHKQWLTFVFWSIIVSHSQKRMSAAITCAAPPCECLFWNTNGSSRAFWNVILKSEQARIRNRTDRWLFHGPPTFCEQITGGGCHLIKVNYNT